MRIPILSKSIAKAEQRAAGKTVAAFRDAARDQNSAYKHAEEQGAAFKAFLTGNAALPGIGGNMSGQSAMQSAGSWDNTGNTLLQRVNQNLMGSFGAAPPELEEALAEQGLSWGPPFPPGRPLDPFYGYRRAPRTWDYTVGENIQLTPRNNRVSFETLRALYENYDVAQICVRHLINDVRSLEYSWEPIPGIKEDVYEDKVKAEEFFSLPDKRQPFRTWLAEFVQDVLRYDAGCLYIRRNEADKPIALEVVNGTTIIPLIDFFGRRPEDETGNEEPDALYKGEIVPAYLQIIEGLPWDWLAADDLIYQPFNPLPESQYGLAPLEAVLMSANTDLRFQWHFLQFFTEGTMPAGFMEAPPDMSDPAQIQQWQQNWDAIMNGEQAKRQQIRWVPNGAKFTPAKPKAEAFESEFPLYLMRRTCAAFGVTPNDLGFTENVNKSSGDTQIDVQFRVGTGPLLRYCEDIVNLFAKEYLKLRVRIKFDDGRETEDRVATAQAQGIYLDHGVIGADEVRQDLGFPIDKSRPTPRYINNTRVGPMPLIALETVAGETDEETYGPADSNKPPNELFSGVPGVIPPAKSPAGQAAEQKQEEILRQLVESATGEPPVELQREPKLEHEKPPEAEPPEGDEEETPLPDPSEVTKENWQEILARIDSVHVVEPAVYHVKEATAGITATTGVAGYDLGGEDDDDDDDAEKELVVSLALRRWRANSRNRMKKGRAPRAFYDPSLPSELHDAILQKLSQAQNYADIDAAFKASAKKAGAPHRRG